jgi:hypothetical protein
LVLLGQISDLILKLAVVALWKARDNHVDAGRRVLAAHGGDKDEACASAGLAKISDRLN